MNPTAWAHRGEKQQPPLHYTDCGLDDIYLISGYEVVATPYGEGLTIKNLDGLHQAIAHHLACQKKALSGKELRFLRIQMDLTQSDLGKLLGLSSQQVARWEKDQCEISGPADRLIRLLFIEHAGGAFNVQEFARDLEEIDASFSDKAFFEETKRGWKFKGAVIA